MLSETFGRVLPLGETREEREHCSSPDFCAAEMVELRSVRVFPSCSAQLKRASIQALPARPLTAAPHINKSVEDPDGGLLTCLRFIES